MEILIQVLGGIAFIVAIFSMLYKNKTKILLFIAIYNLIILISYLLLGQYLGCILIGIETIRSFVYFIFTIKNLKPNIYIYIVFNVLAIVVSIIFWISWYDIFMLISLILNTYITWQPNVKVIKAGTILSTILLIIYNYLIGAYIYIVSEVAFGLAALYSLISIIKNEKREKKTKKTQNNEITKTT